MEKTALACMMILLATSGYAYPVRAQEAPPAHDMSHMHHGNHRGMHHAIAKNVKLEQTADAASHTITLRLGPMNLPAHQDHMEVAQPPDKIWTIPVNGWLVAYHPRLVDAEGKEEPGRLLHHTAFWNLDRPDFLCPNKEEHIFGAGGEMNDWAETPGYGYRVRNGERIRIETMVHNPTDTDYPQTWLEVRVEYRDAPAAGETPKIKSVYPIWMDVMECGNSGYDLPPGHSVKTGTVSLHYSGALLGVGGHMHNYGRRLILEDITQKDTVATLDTKLDDAGRMLSMPVMAFYDRGGYRLEKGDALKITATYDNPTSRLLRDGAMGIVVGYFLPDNDAEMVALRRPGKKVIAKK